MFERHTPLFFHWDHRPLFTLFNNEFQVDDAGAAIILALYAANGPVSYSRNRNHYSAPTRYRSRLYTYAKVMGAVDQLARAGVIIDHRVTPGNLGWQSSMELTAASRVKTELITGNDLFPRVADEAIILRDSEKRLCDYRDTPTTRAMRRKLFDLNEALMSCSLQGTRACPLYRIFNRSFARGGRFYSAGGWQSMPKEKRGQLKIDGKPVVEIDFKTLHPSLTYAQAGLPMPGDAYDIDPWPRDLVKPAFLILLNAETKQSARAAIAHNKNMEQFAEIGSAEAHVVAGRLIADILQRHRPIARAFFSDQGARLMCIDSKISETTMMRLHARGLVTLPVHDSYLIDRAHAGDLEEAMDFAATKAGFPNLKTETRH